MMVIIILKIELIMIWKVLDVLLIVLLFWMIIEIWVVMVGLVVRFCYPLFNVC